MGLGMATNLAKAGVLTSGCESASAARMAAACVGGLALVDSPAAVAARSDLIFTCLPSITAVREVYQAADGLIAAARPGMIIAECSAIDSDMARGLAKAMRHFGGHADSFIQGGVGVDAHW